jgi:hypothetical protein
MTGIRIPLFRVCSGFPGGRYAGCGARRLQGRVGEPPGVRPGLEVELPQVYEPLVLGSLERGTARGRARLVLLSPDLIDGVVDRLQDVELVEREESAMLEAMRGVLVVGLLSGAWALTLIAGVSKRVEERTTSTFPQRRDTVVVRSGPPIHQGVGRLVEELAIGTLNGAENYRFNQIMALALGPDGSIFIADDLEARISQYDSAGRFVRSMGRLGEGPGEFGGSVRSAVSGGATSRNSLVGVTVLSDGRIAGVGWRGRRVNFYGPRGQPLLTQKERKLSTASFLDAGSRIMATPAEVIFVELQSTDTAYVELPFRSDAPRQYARWRPDGTPMDTLIVPHWYADPPLIYLGRREKPQWMHQVPFTPDFRWALSPRGYFVTGMPVDRGGTYSVELRLPVPRPGDNAMSLPRWRVGDPVRSIRVPYVPVPVAAEEKRDWRAAYERIYRTGSATWRWNGPDIPATKPPYKWLWVDGEGRIWATVSAPTPARRAAVPAERMQSIDVGRLLWPEPEMFDVIEPGGRYIGRVESPEPMRIFPQAAKGDRLWAIVDSEDGRITVKRYRMVW